MQKKRLKSAPARRPKARKKTRTIVENSEDSDFIIARKIQAAMIPRRLPTVEGIDMASLYLPCSGVGGDLFDVMQLSDDILAFLICDVTGHRVSSTLISALAKVRFYSHIRAVTSPRVVIERVNAEIIRDVATEFYLTAFVGYLDLHDNNLTYSNAGHINPVIYRAEDGSLVPLKPQGTLIGILDDGYYDEQSVYLNPGDRFLLFTDGILNVFGDRSAPTTRKILDRMIQKEAGRCTPQQLVDYFRTQGEHLLKTRRQGDDLSLIAVEVLTQSRRNQIKERLGFAPDSPVYLQTLCYYEEMDRTTAIILSAMDVFGYPDEIIRKMKVSLTELLVNAIHHGNAKDYTRKVFVGHIVDGKKTVVSIMDEGQGFTPDMIPDPTLPENIGKDCGRGLYIVRHYVDAIEFNPRANRVTITKHHPYG
ncbi:MAG: SpoIIE family protein phosphatase [Chitinispirillaceae bacterium]|nr:SpoIIE family protein phosphatase [Chitinispirillaceae bacterium]